VEQFTVDGSLYISGFLVKFEREGSEEVADTARRRITTEMIANAIQAKARFFLHVGSMVIAFHPVAPEIGRPLFLSQFAAIFKAAHGGFFVDAEVQLIQEHAVVLEVLQRFAGISRVAISLHPSNPRNRDRWRVFDERIKALNASSYKEEYVAKIDEGEPGIRAAEDAEIQDKIAMAQDRYGEARVTGVLDGRIRTVTTKASPISAVAPSDEAAPPRTILEVIHETVRKYLEHFR
jgi:hypothetical protein